MCAEEAEEGLPRRPARPLATNTLGGAPRNDVGTDDEMDDETALKILRGKMTWEQWFLYDFLRYWYGVGALALVAFSVTYIAWRYHVDDPVGLSVLAVGGFALIVLEFFLYKAIWPMGAFTQGWPAGRRLRKAILRLRWRL
jgi:hypothetical protein